MSFVIRAVHADDLSQLVDLAKQFTLLNLPGEKKIIAEKISKSKLSFAGKLPKEKQKSA